MTSYSDGSEDDLPLAKLTEKADEDDLPLSVIQSSLRLVSAMVATKNPPSEVDEPEKYSTDPISPQQAERVYHELTIVCDKTYSHSVSYCTHYQCCDEVFGACCSCLSFLCYDHFVNDSPCSMHTSCHNNKSFAHLLNQDSSLEIDDEATQFDFMDETSFLDDTAKDPDFVPNYKEDSDDSVFDTNDSLVDENKNTDEMRPEENKEMRTEDSRDPSAFPVEGEPRESVSESGTPRKRKRPKTEREIRKERRNKGCEYTTESGKKMPKKSVGVRCKSSRCRDTEFYCHELTEQDRIEINVGFFRSGQLSDQRNFLASCVDSKETTKKKEGSRKNKTMIYTLPIHEQRKQVCRHMFLSTLGVTERQIRTALKKRQRDGQIAMEGRGGRRETEKVEDEEKRQSSLDHINKFPRMESHYCRANTKNEFLAPELNLTTMYNMYVSEMAADKKKPASRSLYNNIFKSLGLKFFALKKDACGICLRKMKENPTDESFLTMYQKHMDEKVKVRQVKEEAKKMASENPKICAAVFDLQQVIYTPKSHHSSIFYKRRLANYNFTIFDLQSQEGRCYLWHEGVARRGANEISTCIYKFLQEKDSHGTEEVILFCDGCVGQNKNSVLPSMILYTLEDAKNLKKVTVNYFETNHGQNEGDCMHSVIERKVSKQPEIMVPSQLATLIQTARATGKKQYTVYEINTVDVIDWKRYGQDIGLHAWRDALDGNSLVWTKVMSVALEKRKGECDMLFKHSHMEEFSVVSKPPKRQKDKYKSKTLPRPQNAYASVPKLSLPKFNDLIALCSGPKPVVYQQDQIMFYSNLPHTQK